MAVDPGQSKKYSKYADFHKIHAFVIDFLETTHELTKKS